MNPLKILAALLLFVVINACNSDNLEISEAEKKHFTKESTETQSNDFEGCETAFAKWTPVCEWEGWVFASSDRSNPNGLKSLNLTQNRWGWAINIPDGHSTTGTFELWAGAAKNDTDNKGTLVGTVVITRSSDSGIKVTYNIYPGYSMTEAHIYASDEKPSTIAPGQFGFTKEFDPGVTFFSEDFTAVDSDNDGVWIIAHSVVCKD